MKRKIILVCICILALTIFSSAQSVVITKKAVTYKRPKPNSEYKHTFVVNYPKVKASTPSISKLIEAAISYEKVFDMKLSEEMGEYQWLEVADYEIGYNKNGILSISLFMEGSAAYPDSSRRFVVIDTKTGKRVTPAAAFTNAIALLKMVIKAKDQEVAQAISDLKKDPENADAPLDDMFRDSEQYNKVSLNEFSISDRGVTFHHNYGFAHVAKALEPNGEFMFTWAQLKPFIKSGGLLSRIAR
ncbi:MAG TPA: hypothetical protein PLP07_13495 [Pyrinomonadaceae bacterium]|nr:hypothetical protein [Chloracidobacterium sp.]MBP9936273.1 hypothetical protein [Pyrinomonadaceae bacterium]MBK7803691.1 hypothetical protein [Chloracidobacterium sp.]MBK9439621.1 hypothetical protein [Chloracidobacterium sp.]MBK9768108.1 hypothetical protein [Chloracidobacterium sp.]